jgi:ABC-2 type transport system permease protein
MIYGPAVLTVWTAICELFFKTYYQSENVQEQFACASPIFAYSQLFNSHNNSSFIIYFIGIIVVTVISIAFGVVLYRIRPSEVSGKSMAFKNTQVIIKFLIVLPTAIVGGLLFMRMSDTTSFGLMLFGIVFIGFLAHGIIEIIYNNDFKSIIANKIQLAVCIVLSLGIAGAAKTDLIQFDSYIPNANQVESMSVDFEDIEPNYEYFDLNNEYYDTNQFNPYNRVSSDTYRLDHINMTNFDSAYQLVKYAKDNNYRETENLLENSTDEFTTFTVKYTLKNKKEIYRVYTVKLIDIMKYVNDIYADENYKEGAYQILTLDRSLIHSIRYYNIADGTEEDLKLTEEQEQEFIDIFDEDLKALTANELVEIIPVTQLLFQIGGDDSYSKQSYYVYPQFTKTIEYMKSLGADLDDNTINPDNIDAITITDYNIEANSANEDKLKEYTFTDREQIDAISKAIIPNELTRGTMLNTNIERNLEVNISYKYVGNYKDSVCIIIDKLPTDIRKQIGY